MKKEHAFRTDCEPEILFSVKIDKEKLQKHKN